MKIHTYYLMLGFIGLTLIIFDVPLFGIHIGYFFTGFALGSLWSRADILYIKVQKKHKKLSI